VALLNKKNPFKRGVMRFDDYSYNLYNKYILLENSKQSVNKVYANNAVAVDGTS